MRAKSKVIVGMVCTVLIAGGCETLKNKLPFLRGKSEKSAAKTEAAGDTTDSSATKDSAAVADKDSTEKAKDTTKQDSE